MGKYADLISNYALYGENGYYVEPFIIHMMIVDELKLPMSFNEIKTFIKECNISITADEIKEFLDKKMVEEDKRRIDASVEKMKDMVTASKYYFEPYSLKYFKTYVSILKEKCSTLFDVLADLDKIKTEEITEEGRQRILDLDFHINEEGNVYVEDINRFAEALVYNVKDLYEKVTKGNNPETYLTFKESRHRLMKDGVFESEIYPRKEIQIKDIYYAHCKQFIALSKQQEEQLKKKE